MRRRTSSGDCAQICKRCVLLASWRRCCLTRSVLPATCLLSAGRGPFAVRVGRRCGCGRWPAGAGAFVPSIQLHFCIEEPGILEAGILDSCSVGRVVASNDSCRMHAGAPRGWLPPAGSCQPGRTRHGGRHQRHVWHRLEAHYQISGGRSRPAAQGQRSAAITFAALEEQCDSDFSHGALLAAVQGGCIAAFGLTLVSPAGSAPYIWSFADIVLVCNCLWLTAVCCRAWVRPMCCFGPLLNLASRCQSSCLLRYVCRCCACCAEQWAILQHHMRVSVRHSRYVVPHSALANCAGCAVLRREHAAVCCSCCAA